MTTKDLRDRLPPPDTVDRVFDHKAITKLAHDAKLPATADLNSFGRAIRNAVHRYLEEAAALQPGEHRDHIAHLARAASAALEGEESALQELIARLDGLPLSTREFLDWRASVSGRRLPTGEEFSDPEEGVHKLQFLYGLCHRGAQKKAGRKRPGGKRSRPTWEPIIASPTVKRGRPKHFAEFLLCNGLEIAYFKATGKRAALVVDHRKPGPFLRLVTGVLELLGMRHINTVELVNEYGRKRKRWNCH